MAAEHDILAKCEDAMAGLVATLKGSELSAVTVHKGHEAEELSIDDSSAVLLVEAVRGLPEEIGTTITGNYRVMLVLTLVSTKGRGRAAHKADAAKVSEMLARSDVTTQIEALSGDNAVANFGAHDYTPGEHERDVEDEHLVTQWDAELYCQPSDLG